MFNMGASQAPYVAGMTKKAIGAPCNCESTIVSNNRRPPGNESGM